jgi:hypothetical protein
LITDSASNWYPAVANAVSHRRDDRDRRGHRLNLPHYPRSVTRLVLIEPEPHMARRPRRRAAESGRDVEIIEATAGQLPLPDASFDTAVVTFALCSERDGSFDTF